MARDYTKYTVEGLGENLNKRNLVFEIVKDYVIKNKPSLEELKNLFPDNLEGTNGSWIFISKESDVKDANRFNMKDPLTIKNGVHVVVSNQWGSGNIFLFIAIAEKLGYLITLIDSINEEFQTESNDSVIQLPSDLILRDYNPGWGRYIEFTFENSPDCYSYSSKVQIDTVSNSIIPFNPNDNENNLTYKWFDSWEAMLSSDNKYSYSSTMSIRFTNTIKKFTSSENEWSIVWHDQFEGMNDGEFPKGVSSDIINNIFSNEWFSNLYSFVYHNRM
jgi:hypothetical protein